MLDELQMLLQEEPVIMISGPRASGKTTLLREIQTLVGGTLIDLADDDVLATVGLDPAGYLHELPRPLLIDEYQRLPKILGVVKRLIDDNGQPGDVVLTGSATGAILPRGTETLAGRVHEMTLWGLSQGELRGVREQFIGAAFDQSHALIQKGLRAEIRSDYVAAVTRGGFPKAVEREREVARRRWLTDYVNRVIDRDLPALVSLRNPQLLGRLLRTSASRTAQVTNMTEVAQTLGTTPATVATYIDLLERVFLVERLPAFSRNLTSRISKHPKLHITDSGLAAALTHLDQTSLGRHPVFGAMLETFVVSELRKQIAWASTEVTMSHFRDRDGHEVDIILEDTAGRVIAIEVKAAVSVDGADVAGLRFLADRLGSDFLHGFVLYTGQATVRINDDRFTATPVSSLWL
jgi:uncharacterized protein